MSNLITEKDTFAEYKYNVSEFYIIIGGETIDIPTERITDFKIEHYFENAIFPIFKVSMNIEPSRYYKIIKAKDKVKFKIRIQSWYRKNGSEKESMLKDIINDTFSIFTDEDDEDYELELKKDAKTDKDENELDKLSNNVEFFLFKTNLVTGLKTNIEKVLTGVTLTTTVAYLLSKAGASNVLMSPFDNTKSYPELILPPQTILRQLMYLNNNYGFHKKGTMIYFGLKYNYILNYKAGCTAWYKNEWKETVIYVLEKNNTLSHLSGSVIKSGEKKFYYSVKTEGVQVTASSISSNAIQGTDAYEITMSGGGSTSKQKGSNKLIGKSGTRVMFNGTSNPYMASTYAAQQQANSVVINLSIENANIEAFYPNKKVSVIFESQRLNSKYKGTYRIASAIYYFTNKGDNYEMSGIITLKKVG